MSKPVLQVWVRSMAGKGAKINAVFDTVSHPSIIQEAKLPPRTTVWALPKTETYNTASRGGRLHVTGVTVLFVQIGKKVIRGDVLVSPDLRAEMIVGAGTMQQWHISIHNGGGPTRVTVGKDLRDPDVTEID